MNLEKIFKPKSKHEINNLSIPNFIEGYLLKTTAGGFSIIKLPRGIKKPLLVKAAEKYWDNAVDIYH